MMNCGNSYLPLIGESIAQGWVCDDLWVITLSWFFNPLEQELLTRKYSVSITYLYSGCGSINVYTVIGFADLEY